jgi:hypothetical protein
MNDIKLVRLSTGEELITKLKSETDESYTLSKPAILIPAGKDQLAFGQWLPYADIKDGIEISKDYVVFVVAPMDEMAQQYDQAFGSGLIVPKNDIATPGLKFTGAEI